MLLRYLEDQGSLLCIPPLIILLGSTKGARRRGEEVGDGAQHRRQVGPEEREVPQVRQAGVDEDEGMPKVDEDIVDVAILINRMTRMSRRSNVIEMKRRSRSRRTPVNNGA